MRPRPPQSSLDIGQWEFYLVRDLVPTHEDFEDDQDRLDAWLIEHGFLRKERDDI